MVQIAWGSPLSNKATGNGPAHGPAHGPGPLATPGPVPWASPWDSPWANLMTGHMASHMASHLDCISYSISSANLFHISIRKVKSFKYSNIWSVLVCHDKTATAHGQLISCHASYMPCHASYSPELVPLVCTNRGKRACQPSYMNQVFA